MIRQFVELTRLGEVLFKEARLASFAHFRQQCHQGGLDVAHECEIDRSAPADVLRVPIDLHFFYAIPRQEFREWKIGPQQQQKIGIVNGFVRSAVTEKPGHAHSIGIVVLQPLLSETKSRSALSAWSRAQSPRRAHRGNPRLRISPPSSRLRSSPRAFPYRRRQDETPGRLGWRLHEPDRERRTPPHRPAWKLPSARDRSQPSESRY